jgi:hypothetical protein
MDRAVGIVRLRSRARQGAGRDDRGDNRDSLSHLGQRCLQAGRVNAPSDTTQQLPVRFEGAVTINRKNWGVSWNAGSRRRAVQREWRNPQAQLRAAGVDVSEAVALFLDAVSVRPLYARAACDNVGSLKVLQKAGLAIIGTDTSYANARGTEIEETILRLDWSPGTV